MCTLHSLEEFVFEKPENRVICAVNTINYEENGATNCIRLAYKAFQINNFISVCENWALIEVHLHTSKRRNLKKMNDWVGSPFHVFECKKRDNHCIYITKHDKVLCVDCSLNPIYKKWSTKKMRNVLCEIFTGNLKYMYMQRSSHCYCKESGGVG